jgi:hypothetical protein
MRQPDSFFQINDVNERADRMRLLAAALKIAPCVIIAILSISKLAGSVQLPSLAKAVPIQVRFTQRR